jgi:hypothetical protein
MSPALNRFNLPPDYPTSPVWSSNPFSMPFLPRTHDGDLINLTSSTLPSHTSADPFSPPIHSWFPSSRPTSLSGFPHSESPIQPWSISSGPAPPTTTSQPGPTDRTANTQEHAAALRILGITLLPPPAIDGGRLPSVTNNHEGSHQTKTKQILNDASDRSITNQENRQDSTYTPINMQPPEASIPGPTTRSDDSLDLTSLTLSATRLFASETNTEDLASIIRRHQDKQQVFVSNSRQKSDPPERATTNTETDISMPSLTIPHASSPEDRRSVTLQEQIDDLDLSFHEQASADPWIWPLPTSPHPHDGISSVVTEIMTPTTGRAVSRPHGQDID